MLITTLGTSHGDATYCRFNTSTLIEAGDASYLIDAGAPVDALMTRKGKSFDKLRAVFITHMHDDHAGGLTCLIKAIVKYAEKDRQPALFYLPEEGADEALTGWLRALHMHQRSSCGPILFRPVRSGALYDDRIARVTAYPTRHMNGIGKSYAYLFEAEGKKVLLSGDVNRDFTDFPVLPFKIDLCLCEATHYPPQAALPVFQKCDIDRLCFYHVHNPWHGAGEQHLLDFYASLPASA
jgi:glyoxylase-like metal-dependent hydrolase (beta-lactamase superfamily II)